MSFCLYRNADLCCEFAALDLAAFVSCLLPHFDGLDPELAFFLPRGIPLVLGFPEVEFRAWTGIDPWFTLHSVLEPSVRSSNSDVENEVERLVERS